MPEFLRKCTRCSGEFNQLGFYVTGTEHSDKINQEYDRRSQQAQIWGAVGVLCTLFGLSILVVTLL